MTEDVKKLKAELKNLRRVARLALRQLAGENIMGGCSACGSERPGTHEPRCIAAQLEKALR